jgi:hypothetical protein
LTHPPQLLDHIEHMFDFTSAVAQRGDGWKEL